MFKWPAKDLGCSEGADWTMDWRQTFIVQNSIFKLPPVTGLCQCWTKCLLSRIAKEFSLVTPFLSARKKAQRYIDRDRGSCSSSTAGHSLWRQKGPIVSSESGMQEGKTIQGLTPGFGTEVPVAGRGCVTSIMWAERTLGHRGQQNSCDVASAGAALPKPLLSLCLGCSLSCGSGASTTFPLALDPNQTYGSTLSDHVSTISGVALMPAFP